MRVLKIVLLSLLGISIVLVGVGFISGMTFNDVKGFFDESYKYTKAEQIVLDDEVDTIIFDSDIKSLNVETHKLDTITIDYYLRSDEKFNHNINNGTLEIESNQPFRLFSFGFGALNKTYNKIVVYLPEDGSYSFDINTDTGDFILTNVKVNNLEVKIDTGDVTINDVNISNVTNIKTSTGNIKISDSKALGVTIKASTGNARLTNFEASNIKIDLSTGNINLRDVISPMFELKTNTGKIEVDGSYPEYSLSLKTTTGTIRVDGSIQGNNYNIVKGSNKIEANTSTGSITINTK